MSECETFECERHPEVTLVVGSKDYCPPCLVMLERDPASMSGDEKAAEVRSWVTNVMTVSFQQIHERVEALVGRGVWTHEMGPIGVERLVEEARGTRTLTSIDEIVNDLRNTGKPVIEIQL